MMTLYLWSGESPPMENELGPICPSRYRRALRTFSRRFFQASQFCMLVSAVLKDVLRIIPGDIFLSWKFIHNSWQFTGFKMKSFSSKLGTKHNSQVLRQKSSMHLISKKVFHSMYNAAIWKTPYKQPSEILLAGDINPEHGCCGTKMPSIYEIAKASELPWL